MKNYKVRSCFLYFYFKCLKNFFLQDSMWSKLVILHLTSSSAKSGEKKQEKKEITLRTMKLEPLNLSLALSSPGVGKMQEW